MTLAKGNLPLLESLLDGSDLLEAILMEPLEASLRVGT